MSRPGARYAARSHGCCTALQPASAHWENLSSVGTCRPAGRASPWDSVPQARQSVPGGTKGSAVRHREEISVAARWRHTQRYAASSAPAKELLTFCAANGSECDDDVVVRRWFTTAEASRGVGFWGRNRVGRANSDRVAPLEIFVRALACENALARSLALASPPRSQRHGRSKCAGTTATLAHINKPLGTPGRSASATEESKLALRFVAA